MDRTTPPIISVSSAAGLSALFVSVSPLHRSNIEHLCVERPVSVAGLMV
jgi:hypothetical protein